MILKVDACDAGRCCGVARAPPRFSKETAERFRVKSEANDWSSDDRLLKGGIGCIG